MKILSTFKRAVLFLAFCLLCTSCEFLEGQLLKNKQTNRIRQRALTEVVDTRIFIEGNGLRVNLSVELDAMDGTLTELKGVVSATEQRKGSLLPEQTEALEAAFSKIVVIDGDCASREQVPGPLFVIYPNFYEKYRSNGGCKRIAVAEDVDLLALLRQIFDELPLAPVLQPGPLDDLRPDTRESVDAGNLIEK